MREKKRILIVEDEVKIADLISDYLNKDGFAASSLYHGEKAVETIRKTQPHLILLDLMLPGTDGLTICREVRTFSQVPIIMLTAKVEEIDRLLGLELGADDYICKPFSPREVVARVKAVLRRCSATEENARSIAAGDVVIDEEKRLVTVKGKNVSLTPSEFGLLQVMMRCPGRVFSRSELLDKVQGYTFDGYDRTIDSHVKNLRKKMSECASGLEFISTIYGVGYKFNPEGS